LRSSEARVAPHPRCQGPPRILQPESSLLSYLLRQPPCFGHLKRLKRLQQRGLFLARRGLHVCLLSWMLSLTANDRTPRTAAPKHTPAEKSKQEPLYVKRNDSNNTIGISIKILFLGSTLQSTDTPSMHLARKNLSGAAPFCTGHKTKATRQQKKHHWPQKLSFPSRRSLAAPEHHWMASAHALQSLHQ